MTENTGYGSFTLYWALKLHFTSNYDYFKYNGKSKMTKEAFEKNASKYSFYKLSRKYSYNDLKNFYVANFLHSETKWISDLLNAEAEDNYRKWQKVNQSLTYVFEQDIMHLLDSVDNPEELLEVKPGKYPLLLSEAMEENIAIETLCIMNDLMGFFAMWSNKITDDIIWPKYKNKCEKYTPFINYEKNKFRNILKESIKSHAH